MSIEMLREANPVPPGETAGRAKEENAQRLLASILAEEPSRSFSERFRALAPARLVRTVAVATVLLLVALAFSVTIPFDGGNGGGGKVVQLGLLGRAAAALPDRGEVAHIVWVQPDFASDSPAMTLRYREWFDRSNGTDHKIINKGRRSLDVWTISGRVYVASNSLINPKTQPSVSGSIVGTPVAKLVENYRKALDSKQVVLMGRGRAFGKPVFWMRFRCAWSYPTPEQELTCRERLALDRRTYLPVVWEMHNFKKAQQWNRDHTSWTWYYTHQQSNDLVTTSFGVSMRYRILKVGLIPRDKANIIPPAGIFER